MKHHSSVTCKLHKYMSFKKNKQSMRMLKAEMLLGPSTPLPKVALRVHLGTGMCLLSFLLQANRAHPKACPHGMQLFHCCPTSHCGFFLDSASMKIRGMWGRDKFSKLAATPSPKSSQAVAVPVCAHGWHPYRFGRLELNPTDVCMWVKCVHVCICIHMQKANLKQKVPPWVAESENYPLIIR